VVLDKFEDDIRDCERDVNYHVTNKNNYQQYGKQTERLHATPPDAAASCDEWPFCLIRRAWGRGHWRARFAVSGSGLARVTAARFVSQTPGEPKRNVVSIDPI